MKKYLIPILLLILNSRIANATNLIVTGPSVTQTSMGPMVSGDTLKFTTGNYTSINLANLHNITICNYNGLVTFSGSGYIDFGYSQASMHDIHWTGSGYAGLTYGFKFTNSSDAFLFTVANNQRLEFDHIDFEGVPNNEFDCSGYSTNYTGDSSTFKWYRVRLHDLLMNNSGQIYQGTYGTIEQTPYISDSISMWNILCNNTSYKGSLVVGPISRLNAHDWSIIFIGTNSVTGDVGAFQVAGNGSINHIYEYGGRGYICRMLNFSLVAFPSAFTFYDNIKLATNAYGLIDWRQDTSFYGGSNPLYTTSNASIFNNDEGNTTDVNGYITTIAIIGVTAGAHCYVRNNLGFNNQYGANPIINDNSNGSWTSIASDTSNNKYLSAAQAGGGAVLADTNQYCNLASGSPIAASGVATFVTVDYTYRTLSSPPPTGAEAYQSALTPPTLTAAAGATVDNPFTITFTDNSTWRSDVTAVQINGTNLPGGAYSFGVGTLTLTPSASSLLQTPATVTVTVLATGYTNDQVSQTIGVGAAAKLIITTQPLAPLAYFGQFNREPVLNIEDQYNNLTASTATVTATIGSGTSWALSGTTSVSGSAGVATFTTLGATNSLQGNNTITVTFVSSGLTSATSNSMVLAPAPPASCNCVYAYFFSKHSFINR